MIVDVKGKKLVFGMVWKPIVGGGSLTAEAAKIAKDLKSDRIWQVGQLPVVGVATGSDASMKLKEKLYAGAMALAAITRRGNTLFVYQLPPSPTESARYIVCGIVNGRPKAEFDVIASSEGEVADRVEDFALKCTGSFTLAGNVDGLRALISSERHIEVAPMDLSVIAAAADASTALRKAKSVQMNGQWLFRGAAIVAIVFAGHSALRPLLPNISLPFMRQKPAEKTPQQIYSEALAAELDTLALPVSRLTDWTAWWSAQPFVIGGWKQSKVACNAKTMPVTCVLTYDQGTGATNMSFAQAKPAAWPEPRYATNGKQITVALRIPSLRPSRIGELAKKAPTLNGLALTFGSALQQVNPISERTNNGTPQLFPMTPGVDAAILSEALYTGNWQVVGPLRNADLLATLPPYTTITDLTLNINLKATPSATQSKLMLDLGGIVFARKS